MHINTMLSGKPTDCQAYLLASRALRACYQIYLWIGSILQWHLFWPISQICSTDAIKPGFQEISHPMRSVDKATAIDQFTWRTTGTIDATVITYSSQLKLFKHIINKLGHIPWYGIKQKLCNLESEKFIYK